MASTTVKVIHFGHLVGRSLCGVPEPSQTAPAWNFVNCCNCLRMVGITSKNQRDAAELRALRKNRKRMEQEKLNHMVSVIKKPDADITGFEDWFQCRMRYFLPEPLSPLVKENLKLAWDAGFKFGGKP